MLSGMFSGMFSGIQRLWQAPHRAAWLTCVVAAGTALVGVTTAVQRVADHRIAAVTERAASTWARQLATTVACGCCKDRTCTSPPPAKPSRPPAPPWSRGAAAGCAWTCRRWAVHACARSSAPRPGTRHVERHVR